jgi:hypothetical protein
MTDAPRRIRLPSISVMTDTTEPLNDPLAAACEATLLFFSGSPWDAVKAEKWAALTGTRECTTKTLCDFVRAAIAKAPDA